MDSNLLLRRLWILNSLQACTKEESFLGYASRVRTPMWRKMEYFEISPQDTLENSVTRVLLSVL